MALEFEWDPQKAESDLNHPRPTSDPRWTEELWRNKVGEDGPKKRIRCVQNTTSAKVSGASTPRNTQRVRTSSSFNRMWHATFEPPKRWTKHCGPFPKCFSNIGSAVAARRYDTGVQPPAHKTRRGWCPAVRPDRTLTIHTRCVSCAYKH